MTNPIIPWIGGKRRLSKRLLALFESYNFAGYVMFVFYYAGAVKLERPKL